MENLKDFMLFFRLPSNQLQPTAAQLAAMRQHWGIFIGNIAASARLVSATRLGFEGSLIDKSMQAENSSYTAAGQILSGCMMVKAATLKEAAEMTTGCPILSMGGTVEIRNVIPMES